MVRVALKYILDVINLMIRPIFSLWIRVLYSEKALMRLRSSVHPKKFPFAFRFLSCKKRFPRSRIPFSGSARGVKVAQMNWNMQRLVFSDSSPFMHAQRSLLMTTSKVLLSHPICTVERIAIGCSLCTLYEPTWANLGAGVEFNNCASPPCKVEGSWSSF